MRLDGFAGSDRKGLVELGLGSVQPPRLGGPGQVHAPLVAIPELDVPEIPSGKLVVACAAMADLNTLEHLVRGPRTPTLCAR
jgi:hypothetical protein